MRTVESYGFHFVLPRELPRFPLNDPLRGITLGSHIGARAGASDGSARIYLHTYVLARSRPLAAWHRRKRPLIAELARSLLHSGSRCSTQQLHVGFCAGRALRSRPGWLSFARWDRSRWVDPPRSPFARPSPSGRLDSRRSKTDRTFARTSDYFRQVCINEWQPGCCLPRRVCLVDDRVDSEMRTLRWQEQQSRSGESEQLVSTNVAVRRQIIALEIQLRIIYRTLSSQSIYFSPNKSSPNLVLKLLKGGPRVRRPSLAKWWLNSTRKKTLVIVAYIGLTINYRWEERAALEFYVTRISLFYAPGESEREGRKEIAADGFLFRAPRSNLVRD